MSLPKDKFLMLSYVNTQLRDNYPSLEEMCKALNVDKEKVIADLKEIGYEYFKDLNAFK